MTERAWKTRLRNWILQDRERAGRLLFAGLCLLLAVAVLLVLVFRKEAPPEEFPAAESTSEWPDCELTAGLTPPEQGTVVAVRQTDTSVAVYLTGVPSESLPAYLRSMGFSGTESPEEAPCVAYADGRILAVKYDAAEERLSLTVVRQ